MLVECPYHSILRS